MSTYYRTGDINNLENLKHFAIKDFVKLVAAKEREKVAAWMIEQGYATGHGDTVEEMLEELEWQIRERGERNGKEAQ